MKKLLFSTIAILALESTLFAGGKLVAPPSVPPVPVITDSWSGPYIGLQAGYIQGKGDGEVSLIKSGVGREISYMQNFTYHANGIKPKGFIGGIYLGYNKLLDNNWLAGIEFACNYMNIKKKATLYNENNSPTSAKLNLKQKGEAALYAKFGKVVGNNNSTLLYGLAGISATKLYAGYEVGNLTIWDKDTVTGFTVGAGLEYKLNKNWHTRVQYRYSKYKDAKYDFTSAIKGKVKNYKTHSIMAGISYHFN